MRKHRKVLINLIFVSCILLPETLFAEIPDKTSKLNGWQGIKIVQGKRCADCCDLIFPNNFGYKNRNQLNDLLKIIRSRKISHDLGCMAPSPYYALALSGPLVN